jgi:hypothetical protein
VEAVSFSETPVPTYRLQRDLITQNITVWIQSSSCKHRITIHHSCFAIYT